nr:hypothetical protein [uncultured Schaedlerella sp.]
MKNRKLKRYLASVQVPEYSPQGLQETIARAGEIQFFPEKQRMTNLQFFRNQLRFIGKEFWGVKFIFTGIFLYLILSGSAEPDSWIMTAAAISGPIVFMADANILCDIFWKGMLELQMTAKHSLRKVLICRMLVSGIADFLILACAASAFTLAKGIYLRQTLLYMVVPYNLMCFGCLAVLNRRTEENTMLYCMTWGILLTFAIILSKSAGIPLFEVRYTGNWLFFGGTSALGAIWEMKRLLKFGGGNVDEVSVGTFV